MSSKTTESKAKVAIVDERGQDVSYPDASAHTKAVFNTLFTVPSAWADLLIPSAQLSVLALAKHKMASFTSVSSLPEAAAYFGNSLPPTIVPLQLIQTLPIPPLEFVLQLIALAPQFYLDGMNSVSYLHCGNKVAFPFWVLQVWKAVAEALPDAGDWAQAELWLSKMENGKERVNREVAERYRATLFDLPWGGNVCGFGLIQPPVRVLAKFLSREWLSDTHEDLQLELLRQELLSDPATALLYAITDTAWSSKLQDLYKARDSGDYTAEKFPLGASAVHRLGTALAQAKTPIHLSPWFINKNHWTSTVVDTLTSVVYWGDPKKETIPTRIQNSLSWFLKTHLPDKTFRWDILPSTDQADDCQCSILSITALGHQALPQQYPLSGNLPHETNVARMEIGLRLVLRHQRMRIAPVLPIPTSSESDDEDLFDFTALMKKPHGGPPVPPKRAAKKARVEVDEVGGTETRGKKKKVVVVLPGSSPFERARKDGLTLANGMPSATAIGIGKFQKREKEKEQEAGVGESKESPKESKESIREGKKHAREPSLEREIIPLKPSARTQPTNHSDEDGEEGLEEDLSNIEDLDEPVSTKGRPTKDGTFLRAITRLCKVISTGEEHFRCVGVNEEGFPCRKMWAAAKRTRNRARILKHACHCQYIDQEHRRKANEVSVGQGLASQIHELKDEAASSAASTHAVKAKPNQIVHDFRRQGTKLLNLEVNLDIVHLVCVAGLPPRLIEYPQWRTLMARLNSSYTPISRTTLEDTHIVEEASRVRGLNLKYLRTQQNLTVSFDGGSTLAKESIYTVHFTTPDGRSFLVDGQNASGESHTGEHVADLVIRNIRIVGEDLVSGVASDGTGNSRVPRGIVSRIIPTIIDMTDVVHHLNLLMGDLCKLPVFKPIISTLRPIVTYFSKSNFGVYHFKLARIELEIPRGIETIGKTRFATVALSSISVKRALPAIRQVVQRNKVVIPNPKINALFVKDSHLGAEFEMGLTRMIKILEPVAKAIACLESSQLNPGDVYLFWLAVMSLLKVVLDDPASGFGSEDAAQIRGVANTRYNEVMEEGPQDTFISTFYLDPRYITSPVLRRLNPMAYTITIPGSPPSNPNHRIQARARKYIFEVLQNMGRSGKHSILSQFSPADAKAAFNRQFEAYANQRYPFDVPPQGDQTVRQWWTAHTLNPNASILACVAEKLYSIKPSSIPDERTNSIFTWINTALRNKQEVRTLVDMTQIRQHVQYLGNVGRVFEQPTVKFYDLDQALFGTPTEEGAVKLRKHSTVRSALVVDGDEEEAVEGEPSWLDGPFEGVIPESADFAVNEDVDLSAPELLDLLADRPGVRAARKVEKKKEVLKQTLADEGSWDSE